VEVMIDISNLQIDYNLISYKYFENWRTIAGGITGLLLVLFFTPFYILSDKAASLRCEKLFPNERVIYTIKSGWGSRITITFLIGAFLGNFILPFFVFENLFVIRQLHRSYLLVYIVLLFIGIYGAFFRFNMIYLLTNKNIRLISPYKILDIMYKKFFALSYEDIESVTYTKNFFIEQLLINLKSGKTFNGLICFEKLKNAKEIIDKYTK